MAEQNVIGPVIRRFLREEERNWPAPVCDLDGGDVEKTGTVEFTVHWRIPRDVAARVETGLRKALEDAIDAEVRARKSQQKVGSVTEET